jgi:hypothetical protein
MTAITLIPRFGWRFGTQLTGMDNFYRYRGTQRESGNITESYENKSGNQIGISYPGRLSRHLSIFYDGELVEEIDVQMDRGISGDAKDPESLTFVMYDILSADASGSFFLIYLKAIGMIILSFASLNYLRKYRDTLSNSTGKVLRIGIAAMFLVSLLLSFRVI